MKKYKLTDETKEVKYGTKHITIVHRIQALKDFTYSEGIFNRKIKSGDLGGFVEKEENLSQQGNAWVANESIVYDDARVLENAVVTLSSEVYGNAVVSGNAIVGSCSKVFGNAAIKDCSETRHSEVSGNAVVSGNAKIRDNSQVLGDAKVSGNAYVTHSKIRGNAVIKDNAFINYDCTIFGSAVISGSAEVCCGACICGNANITKSKDWLRVVGIGGVDSGVTFYRNKNNGISVAASASIFEGLVSNVDTIDDFLKFIDNSPKDEESKSYHIYKAAAELAKLQIDVD